LEPGINIEADKKPFRPHITLARIKSRPDKTAAQNLINTLKYSGFTDKKPGAEFGCAGISLKESITGSSPPVHKKLLHAADSVGHP
jgi:2'-5' RNA ligase